MINGLYLMCKVHKPCPHTLCVSILIVTLRGRGNYPYFANEVNEDQRGEVS